VRAKTLRQTITPDGTPGPLCQSSPGRRQTAIFLYREFFKTQKGEPERINGRLDTAVTPPAEASVYNYFTKKSGKTINEKKRKRRTFFLRLRQRAFCLSVITGSLEFLPFCRHISNCNGSCCFSSGSRFYEKNIPGGLISYKSRGVASSVARG
jgi:hypothetical protein